MEEKDTHEFIIMVYNQSFEANRQGQMVWHDDDAGDERDVREDFQGDAILAENRGEERNNDEAR